MPPKTNEDYVKITIAMCDDIIEAITNRIKWKDGVLNIFDVVEPHIKALLISKEKDEGEIATAVWNTVEKYSDLENDSEAWISCSQMFNRTKENFSEKLQKAKNCYCKDKAVIELVEEAVAEARREFYQEGYKQGRFDVEMERLQPQID